MIHCMAGLSPTEQSALQRYVSLLIRRLGHRLKAIWLFGSAARGDLWPPDSPMHSDIDILVITSDTLADAQVEELANDTYPLYLECGRQISPAFRSVDEADPSEEGDDLILRVRAEGHQLWP
jgi:predicted nucleotidyltransferase